MISIVAIGKKHEDWILSGLDRYEKRLKQPFNLKWLLLPHSSLQETQARKEESNRLLGQIDDKSFVILLDETGTRMDSPAFSALLESRFVNGLDIVIVIGGAYGVDERFKQRADRTVSLSDMVFPHQLVRLLLVEQLYRAQEISRGSRYHHE